MTYINTLLKQVLHWLMTSCPIQVDLCYWVTYCFVCIYVGINSWLGVGGGGKPLFCEVELNTIRRDVGLQFPKTFSFILFFNSDHCFINNIDVGRQAEFWLAS